MGKNMLYIFFSIAVLFSCKQQASQSNNKNNNAGVDTGLNTNSSDTLNEINDINKNLILVKNSIDSCHKLLLLLVKSSSFDSNMKKLKFDIWVEDIVKGIARLKLTYKNEERNDVVFSWLEMDFNKKELRDVTIDPDKPIKLKYDSSLFRKVDEYCRLK